MKTRKNKLDEMQEQQLLQIEHNGCWIAFWGLLAAMVVQVFLHGFDARSCAGEWIVFMVLALYMGISCARAGIWDRRLDMGWKTNLLVSLIAALATGLFMFAFSYHNYDSVPVALATGGFIAVFTGLLCFAGLQITARIIKKRQEALEQEPEEDKP